MAKYTDSWAGQYMHDTFQNVRTAYQTGLPGHTQQLRNLAKRKLGG